MKIEDYWIDYTIYEVEYKENHNYKEKKIYDFICCFTKMKQKQIERIIIQKINKQDLRVSYVGVTELFSAFLDKKIDSKIKIFNFYTIKFEVQIKNESKIFERIILEDPKISVEQISKKIVKQLSNVRKVIEVVEIGTALKVD